MAAKLVAVATVTLVANRKLSWDDRVATLLPDSSNQSDSVTGQRCTVEDLHSHRCGLSGLDQAVQGLHGELTLETADIVRFANALPVKYELRTRWWYFNFGYSLVGRIIDMATGGPWASYLETKILKPLQMMRTTLSRAIHKTDSNIAKTYVVLTDGTPSEVRPIDIDGNCVNGAAGGVRSTVSDLLRWSHALMRTSENPCIIDAEHDSSSPGHDYISIGVPSLSSSSDIFSSRTIVDPRAPGANNYGLGIVRQSTPAALGVISPNRDFSSPVIGLNSPSLRVFSHNGDFNGATASMYLLPDSVSAVVVLSNAKGLSDAADWIVQDIIQSMFKLQPPIDVLAESCRCRDKYLRWFKETIQDPLEANRQSGPNNRQPNDYTGNFFMSACDSFALELKANPENPQTLLLVVNGRPSQTHVLSPYHFDTWEFVPGSYDSYIQKGYETYHSYIEFLLSFQRQADETVCSLKWVLDGCEVFFTKKR
ncbi:beta-lactamase/transpeptidase-like protein [Polyplosphaeria fusca]|uniref:Beta-lactamase/transpeptidase-like protein n=1 Tax=Polyplosphaeria fusca TaxID=682080 RepID=A0A9P4RAR3_9PLEO|nr:beta-lactamase/transpeptidase-like protein [Polyplosphaeria fusca]